MTTDNPTLQSEPRRTVLPNCRAYDRAGTGDHSLFSNKHCCVCGRPCKGRAAWLLLTRALDGTQEFAITSPEDATEEERDTSMWIAPIGSDCLRKHPELGHAVINFSSRAPVVAPQKDLRIYDRENSVVTQGAFDALMDKMDSLTEDAELAAEDADRLRSELGNVYANMLCESTPPDASADKCVLCGHERRTYNVEADACEHTTGLTQPQFDVFCGCACRFSAAPIVATQGDALKAAQDFAFLIHRSLHNTETEFHECELGVCRRARNLTASPAFSPVPPEQDRDFGPRSRVNDWPIVDVLGHLASAAEHLLQHHNCDEHGHETWKYAAEAAWKHVALLNKPASHSVREAAEAAAREVIDAVWGEAKKLAESFVKANIRNYNDHKGVESLERVYDAKRDTAQQIFNQMHNFNEARWKRPNDIVEIILKHCSPVSAAGGDEDGEPLVADMQRALVAAGWIAETAIRWRAPDGSLWRGPYGAWKELQRRAAARLIQ